MTDPLTLTTLRNKRDEITAAVKSYEKRLEQARRDLHHVNATIRIFEAGSDPTDFPVHMSTRLLFRRGEIATFCKAELAKDGQLDTRELARRLMRSKALDEGNEPLRITVTYRATQALRFEAKRGGVQSNKPRGGVCVWTLNSKT